MNGAYRELTALLLELADLFTFIDESLGENSQLMHFGEERYHFHVAPTEHLLVRMMKPQRGFYRLLTVEPTLPVKKKISFWQEPTAQKITLS